MLCFHGHLSPMKSLQGFLQMQVKKRKCYFFKLTMFLLSILVTVVT